MPQSVPDEGASAPVDGDEPAAQATPGAERVPARRRLRAWRPGLETLETAVYTVALIWLTLLGNLLLWSGLPMLAGLKPNVVMSESMTPRLRPGDVVLLRTVEKPFEQLQRGSVIQFRDASYPDRLTLHRIVGIARDRNVIVTKGDANRSNDNPPLTAREVLGEGRAVVPFIGYPVVMTRRGQPLPLLILAVTIYLAVRVVADPSVVSALFRRRTGAAATQSSTLFQYGETPAPEPSQAA